MIEKRDGCLSGTAFGDELLPCRPEQAFLRTARVPFPAGLGSWLRETVSFRSLRCDFSVLRVRLPTSFSVAGVTRAGSGRLKWLSDVIR